MGSHDELLALDGLYANPYRMTFAQTEAAMARNGAAGTPSEVTVAD